MNLIQLVSVLGLCVCGLWYLVPLALSLRNKKADPVVSDSVYIFKPDTAHLAYLTKLGEALGAASTEFKLKQILSGASISEALEAYARGGDSAK